MCSLTENEALCYLSWNDLWWFVAAVSNSGGQGERVGSMRSGKNVLTTQLSSQFVCPLIAGDVSVITSCIFSLFIFRVLIKYYLRLWRQPPLPSAALRYCDSVTLQVKHQLFHTNKYSVIVGQFLNWMLIFYLLLFCPVIPVILTSCLFE